MQAFSKVAPPSGFSTDDDDPAGYLPGSEEILPDSPPSKRRSVTAGGNLGVSSRARYPLLDSSRRHGLNRSAHHSATVLGQHPHHLSEDRRSHSIISISSDDPTAAETEILRLREEVLELKIENGRLQGQIMVLK